MGRNPAPINQLSEPVKDGQSDENASNNCTFASLAWIVRDLGTEPDADGDEIHDECEGQGHTGPYDPTAIAFIAAAARRGVTLAIWRGSQAQLVAHLHSVLASGGDALINIPSQWGTAPADPLHPAGSTHCVAVAYDLPGLPQGLRCMNPWGGFWHDGDDAYWAARICYGYILVAVAKEVQPVSIVIERNSAGAITGAHDADDPGKTVGAGMAAVIDQQKWTGAEITVGEQFGLSEGATLAVLRGGTIQVMTYLAAEGVKTFGDRALVEAVQDIALDRIALQQQLAAAQSDSQEVTVLKAQVAMLQGQLAAAQTALGAANTRIANAKAALG